MANKAIVWFCQNSPNGELNSLLKQRCVGLEQKDSFIYRMVLKSRNSFSEIDLPDGSYKGNKSEIVY